ncbi:unnamed protein product [Ilex paraguariensis]|uniref:MOSC domain-containing protein n=1 Tax=Ilex paraguariensis TaxID=185542 RepID=A0ABC8SY42_9AQUA
MAEHTTAKVTSIFIYPIKSCRGISISQAALTSTGFRWDRQWLVVNSKGRAYTQRVEPKLALVEGTLPNEAFSENWEPTKSSYLVIKAPGTDVLKVSLSKPSEISDGVSVWEWSGSAFDEGAEASKWFSYYLGKPSRLVRFNEVSETRAVDPNYAPGYKVMFSDQYPFLLLSQGSLDALNKLLKEPLTVNRFRPKYVFGLVSHFSSKTCKFVLQDSYSDVILVMIFSLLSLTVIKAPGMDVLKVPLSKPSEIADGVSVWEWSGSAFDEGAEASKWFSYYLGKPSRLVRFNEAQVLSPDLYFPANDSDCKNRALVHTRVLSPDLYFPANDSDCKNRALVHMSETRAVDPNYAPGYKVMFSDQYPFLLLSQGSLDALNKLLKEPLTVNRFRPNILVDGCEPFSEDLWKEIRINKLTFLGVKLCSRCKVPTINQDTAIAGSEPTETLMKFRSDKVLRPTRKQQGRVYFGQNLVCPDSQNQMKEKTIKVGDPIYVIKMVSTCVDAAA